jgi:hypothetical protein
MTKEITEDDKLYNIGIDPYEEYVPGKEGKKFELTFDESWHKIPRKEFDAFIDILTMNAINKEALEKEWEEKKKNLHKYITQSPCISKEYISGCGQRYERENNKEEEN